MRSYEDPCGIARALDRVGERWALLVIRELILGPKRFTNLRTGLPGASPNVLSQRLHELEDNGVVHRRTLAASSSTAVYELTPWGRELEPVLLALGRWGGRAVPVPDGELSVDALIIALETTFDPAASDGMTARVALQLGGDRFLARVARKHLTISRGLTDAYDAAITSDAGTLRRVVFGQRDLARARRDGDVTIAGDEAIAARFVTLFPRPVAGRTA